MSNARNPAAILYDASGNPLSVYTGTNLVAGQPGVIIVGTDGTKTYYVKTDSQGRLDVLSSTTNAVRSVVNSATTDQTLFNVDTTAKMRLIYNDSNSVLYVGLGSTPTTLTDFTYPVAAATLWIVPEGFEGEVHGIWSLVNGQARLTVLS